MVSYDRGAQGRGGHKVACGCESSAPAPPSSCLLRWLRLLLGATTNLHFDKHPGFIYQIQGTKTVPGTPHPAPYPAHAPQPAHTPQGGARVGPGESLSMALLTYPCPRYVALTHPRWPSLYPSPTLRCGLLYVFAMVVCLCDAAHLRGASSSSLRGAGRSPCSHQGTRRTCIPSKEAGRRPGLHLGSGLGSGLGLNLDLGLGLGLCLGSVLGVGV